MANQYFTCVLDAWRDGTTLYGRMHYYRSGTYTYQDSSFPDPTMNLGGTTYTDSAFGNRVRSGIQVGDVYTTTFSRTITGTGTRTVTFTAGSGQRSDFAGTWSVDVGGFPGVATPPTGLSVTDVVRAPEGFTATVSITGWGTGSGTRYRELQVWTYSSSGLVEPRKYMPAYGDSLSGTITINNSTPNGSLTIVPNTMYVIGAYATNGAAATGSTRFGECTTLPPHSSLSTNFIAQTSAGFTVSVPNQGGKYDMVLKYQLDSEPLVTVTTLTGAGTKGAAFTVFDLRPGTTHTITAALTTNAGETVSNTITFTTEAAPVTLYGSVNNQAEKVVKMYGPIEQQVNVYTGTPRIAGTATFNADVFNAHPVIQSMQGTISYLELWNEVDWAYMVAVLSDSTRVTLTDTAQWERFPYNFQDFGVTLNRIDELVYIDLSQTTETRSVAKQILKYYGSVNGQAKLVYSAPTNTPNGGAFERDNEDLPEIRP